MEFNFSPYVLQEAKTHFKPEQSTDVGYFSACGSLSPSSSIDSGCFSPPANWKPSEPVGKPESGFKKLRSAPPVDGRRRSRSRNPGMKRQTASEREKLRMRDLTKALHHLRNFLPPSVAPAGQTLTKIETLRLTIDYISYLSAQLEQPETNFQTSTLERLQPGPETWSLDGQQGHFQDGVQYCPTFTTFCDTTQQMENGLPSASHFRDSQSYMFPCTTTHDATYRHQFFQS